MKIAVLMGGISSEREISLVTGSAVNQACISLGHDSVPLILQDNMHTLIPSLKSVDLVFNALHGGDGEDGTIAGFLETLGIPYTGSGPLASALCMDKNISKILVQKAGYRTPAWEYINQTDPSRLDQSKFPVVVKPNSQGSTVGLSIVSNSQGLSSAIKLASSYDSEVLIEQYIAGRELTVAIVGTDVLPIVEIIPTHEYYDYECKYTAGMSQYKCPAELTVDLTNSIQETAFYIYKLLKCKNYSRVDFRLDHEGKFWFLELNTLPGMTATSLVPKAAKAAGINFKQLIERIITEVC